MRCGVLGSSLGLVSLLDSLAPVPLSVCLCGLISEYFQLFLVSFPELDILISLNHAPF